MAEASTKSGKRKSALKGKGGLVALALLAVLGGWLYLDLQAGPPRPAGSNPPVSDYVHMKSTDVTRVELKRPNGGFVLVKQGDRWAFEAPGRHRAGAESVNTWLKGLLEDATVSQTVESKPADFARYGLDNPATTLTLTTRGGETRVLQTGKDFRTPGQSGPSSIYYAREAKDGRLFMLASAQVAELKNKRVDDLRDKRLVEVTDEKAVTKVTAQLPTTTVEVERRGAEKWELVQPVRAPAGSTEMEDLVRNLKDATADSFVADPGTDLSKYGLEKPRLALRVTGKAGTQGVRFGAPAPGDKVYAAREGDSEVTLVSNTTFESLERAAQVAELRERKLVTLSSDKISYVELRNPSGTVTLQKTGGNAWEIAGARDPKQKAAKGDVVQRVLDSLTAPASKHVEEAPADLAKYGLAQPAITVTVNEGSGTSQVLMLGKKSPGGYYAKGAPNAVFEVQSFVFNDLNVKPEAFRVPAK